MFGANRDAMTLSSTTEIAFVTYSKKSRYRFKMNILKVPLKMSVDLSNYAIRHGLCSTWWRELESENELNNGTRWVDLA